MHKTFRQAGGLVIMRHKNVGCRMDAFPKKRGFLQGYFCFAELARFRALNFTAKLVSHADSTGAPGKVESLLGTTRSGDKKYVCYSVGFNIDMTTVAPNAALTSAINSWEVYYEYLFGQYLNNQTIADDWCKGYDADAVAISPLNSKCVADGTQAAVDKAIAGIKAGTIQVFNTDNFKVNNAKVTTHTFNLSKIDYSTGSTIYQGDSVETIKTDNGITYFSESTYRAAPYFDLKVDGITWLN